MDIMKKNPKGGRPPKSASEKLKERLTVKMAAADYYALRGKARAAGLTWAEYARTALSRSVVRQQIIIMNRQPCTIFHHSAGAVLVVCLVRSGQFAAGIQRTRFQRSILVVLPIFAFQQSSRII